MSKRLHVLRIVPRLYRPGNWPIAYAPIGGLTLQGWNLSTEIGKCGVSQTILTSNLPGYPYYTEHPNSIEVYSLGVTLPEFLVPKLSGLLLFFPALRHLVKYRKKYDLVHVHYNDLITCRLLSLMAHLLKIPLVVSLNSVMWCKTPLRKFATSRWFNFVDWIESVNIRAADQVITLTSITAKYWRTRLPQNKNKIVIIADALDIESFRKSIPENELDSFRDQYGIPHDNPVVAFVGRISYEKGWEDLPQIATALHQTGAFLLICGDGLQRSRLEFELKKLNCQESWTTTGILTREEVKMAMKIADILILPSRIEMFGSVLLEAMASGLAAIAYETGGVGEVGGPEKAIRLIPPQDQATLIEAVLELLADPDKRDEFVGRGNRRVKNFSLSQAAANTINRYEEMLASRARGIEDVI